MHDWPSDLAAVQASAKKCKLTETYIYRPRNKRSTTAHHQRSGVDQRWQIPTKLILLPSLLKAGTTYATLDLSLIHNPNICFCAFDKETLLLQQIESHQSR